MQNMNHVNSNFATINISPTAWFLGGAILRYQHSFPGFSGVHVAQSLVFCAVFCRALLVILLFVIILCSSSIYAFLITTLISSHFYLSMDWFGCRMISHTRSSHHCAFLILFCYYHYYKPTCVVSALQISTSNVKSSMNYLWNRHHFLQIQLKLKK